MAEFLVAHKDLIKARFRAQLESDAGGLHDSSDFFASMLRRMDGCLASGHVDDDVVEFLQRLYLETVMDYTRDRHKRAHSSSHRDASAEVSDLVQEEPSRSLGDDSDKQDRPEGLSEQDEQIIRLRASGLNHKAIALVLDMAVPTVRQRWSRLVRSQSWQSRNKAS